MLQLPGHLQLRLQGCRNFPPTTSICPPHIDTSVNQPIHNPTLLGWVMRLQFKMGQIEIQSTAATPFYVL